MYVITVATADGAKSYDVYGSVDESVDAALTMVEGASDATSVTLRKDGVTQWVAEYVDGTCVDWTNYRYDN
jgi:3-hydroxyisobutyrate dehydrogenase-like beta-hydroxyacid dehydrogenase